MNHRQITSCSFLALMWLAAAVAVAVLAGIADATATAFIVLVSFLALTWGWKRSRPITLLIIAGCLFAEWVVAVDWQWIMRECSQCQSDWGVVRYRVFTIPIGEGEVFPNEMLMSRIATDLGVPCQHKLSEAQKQRYRGLFWYVHPSFEGTFSIYAGEEWYDERAASVVHSMARSRPRLPKEFYRKVLLEHDWAYWHAIRGQVLELTRQGKQEKDRDSETARPTRGAERVEG